MKLFLPHHYSAFDEPKPRLDDAPTVAEREKVRDALLELDDALWPFIETTGWDLHRHRHKMHYVSSHRFVYLDGKPIVDFIDGMRLHYGKSAKQLDFLKTIGGYDYKHRDDDDYYNAFYLHTRIQFYLNASIFRCWLLLATDKNYYDRSEFLRRLQKNQNERDSFFQLVVPLFDKGFFYEVAGERLRLQSGLAQDTLLKFVRRDRAGVYSGIVKEYLPDDPALDRERIAESPGTFVVTAGGSHARTAPDTPGHTRERGLTLPNTLTLPDTSGPAKASRRCVRLRFAAGQPLRLCTVSM